MIRKTLAGLVCLSWALWLGGLGALFLFVTRLFAVGHDLAVKAAPELFQVFEKYQLMLAALAILAAAGWRVLGRSPRAVALFWLLGIAAATAAGATVLVTHPMLVLWENGESSSPHFMKLHGWSMMLYLLETLFLIAGGLALPWAFADDMPPRR